jgi:hypothetical protein
MSDIAQPASPPSSSPGEDDGDPLVAVAEAALVPPGVVPSPTATAAAGDGTAAEVVAGKVVSELVLDMHSFPAHMLTSTPLWFRYLMPGFSLGGRRGGGGSFRF